MNLDKKNKTLLVALLVVLISIISYGIFYFVKQSRVVILSENEFYIEEDPNTYEGALADIWLIGYTDQYKQKYLPRKKKIDYIDKSIIDILDEEENIVQIDFTVRPKKKNTDYFNDWGTREGDIIRCQWVLDLEITEDGRCYVKQRMSPAEYDLMIYNSSGQKEEDEYYQEYVEEKPFEKTQYTYKIEGEKLFVSYDSGDNWSEVPISIDELTIGSSYKNQLQDGSYEISPQKTAFIYGGTKDIPLSILYSDDKGENWNKAPLLEVFPRYKYVHFIDEAKGYVVLTFDKTMSQEASAILTTSDGGNTWENVGSGPRTSLLKEARFYNDGIGFFSYPYVEGYESTLYRTEDGGKTFEPVILEAQNLDSDIGLTWNQVYKEANVPDLKDGVMTLFVTQGEDGDYKGGDLMAKYESCDLGKTWIYIDQVRAALNTSEG